MPERRTLRVLVVEDNEADAALLQALLAPSGGFVFRVAPRLARGIEMTREQAYDVALLDLNLPDSAGVVTFERFVAAAPAMPTVILTGDKDDETARAAIRGGASDFLVKGGVTADALARTLRFAVERAAAAEALAEHKRYLEAVGQAVIAIDDRGVIRYWNDAATRLYGWTREEAVGRTSRELRLSALTEEEFTAVIAHVRSGRAWEGEVQARRKDGVCFPAFTLLAPTRNAAGEVHGVIGVSHDLSASKHLEAELRDAVHKARGAQRVAGLFSWHVDLSTNHVVFDDAAYATLGLDPATFRPTRAGGLALLDEAGQAAVRAWLAELPSKPCIFERDLVARRADGAMRILHVLVEPQLDAEGRAVALFGVGHDVTEARAREAEMEKARRTEIERERLSALGTLVAGVAHEVNNPLSYVRGGAELSRLTLADLLAEPALPRPLREQLAEIDKYQADLLHGVDSIERITRALKHIARAPNGARRREDLAKTVDDVLAVAASRLAPGVEVHRDYQGPATATFNAGEISQVLLNILINAGDAVGDRSGHVRVRLGGDDAYALVEVEDDGPGIPPDVAARLFTPFFTTKTEGTGLGLSMSRRIVEDHGGTLTFETQVGKGTTFRVRLPRAPGPA